MRGGGEPLTAEAGPLPSSVAEARRARSRGRTAALGEGPADQPGHLLCGVGAVAKLEGQGGRAVFRWCTCSPSADSTTRPSSASDTSRPSAWTSTPVLEAGPSQCHCPTCRPPSLSSRSCAGRHAAALPSCRPLMQHLVLAARWARSLERPLQIVQGVVDAVQGEPGSARAARASRPAIVGLSHCRAAPARPASACSSSVARRSISSMSWRTRRRSARRRGAWRRRRTGASPWAITSSCGDARRRPASTMRLKWHIGRVACGQPGAAA